MPFMYFFAGLVAASLGWLAFFLYTARKATHGINQRRKDLFAMIRRDLDEARACSKRLGTDDMTARLDVLRSASIQMVASSMGLADAFAEQCDIAWQSVDGDIDPDEPSDDEEAEPTEPSDTRLLLQALCRAEFNARTIALSFMYDQLETEP